MNNSNEKKQRKKKILLLIISFSMILGAIYVYTQQRVNIHHIKDVTYSYARLINSCNKQVQHITRKKRFLLSRDNNDKMILELNSLIKNCYIPDISDSQQYNMYLNKNKTNKFMVVKKTMNADEIKKILKTSTKKSTMADIVKKILMMNSYEIWNKLQN